MYFLPSAYDTLKSFDFCKTMMHSLLSIVKNYASMIKLNSFLKVLTVSVMGLPLRDLGLQPTTRLAAVLLNEVYIPMKHRLGDLI